MELTYVTFMTRVLETGMACSEYKKLQEEWASTWKALGEQTAANPITRIEGSEGARRVFHHLWKRQQEASERLLSHCKSCPLCKQQYKRERKRA